MHLPLSLLESKVKIGPIVYYLIESGFLFFQEYEEEKEEESLSISLVSKASEVSDELFIPEIMENKKEDEFKAIETGIKSY